MAMAIAKKGIDKAEKLKLPYAVKTIEAKVNDVDMSKRIVTGFFNTYNFFDSCCDVLLPGAATKSIQERGVNSSSVQKIKHLMHHDWTQLPGKLMVLDERTMSIEGKNVTGIYFESKLANTTLGNDTLINYQEGIYDNHSIGFRYMQVLMVEKESEDWSKYIKDVVNPDTANEKDVMFIVPEIKLYEGSTVAFGANELTPYLGNKSQNKEALQMKLAEKIKLLRKQIAKGKQSDETLQEMEMKCLQIEQLVHEIFSLEPDEKTLLDNNGRPKTTQDSNIIKGFSIPKIKIN